MAELLEVLAELRVADRERDARDEDARRARRRAAPARQRVLRLRVRGAHIGP